MSGICLVSGNAGLAVYDDTFTQVLRDIVLAVGSLTICSFVVLSILVFVGARFHPRPPINPIAPTRRRRKSAIEYDAWRRRWR